MNALLLVLVSAADGDRTIFRYRQWRVWRQANAMLGPKDVEVSIEK
jgi:hypothetical protein